MCVTERERESVCVTERECVYEIDDDVCFVTFFVGKQK